MIRPARSEEHTSELQSRRDLVCRLLLEKKNAARARACRRLTRSGEPRLNSSHITIYTLSLHDALPIFAGADEEARPLDLTFFFNDPATTEIYTLSLHDALPI